MEGARTGLARYDEVPNLQGIVEDAGNREVNSSLYVIRVTFSHAGSATGRRTRTWEVPQRVAGSNTLHLYYSQA